MVSYLDAGSRGISSSTPAFAGMPTAILLKAAAAPLRSSTAPLFSTATGCICPRFTPPILAASTSLFHGQHHQQHEEEEQSDDDDRNHCRRRRSHSTILYCRTRRGDYSVQRPNISRVSNSPASPSPSSWRIGGHSSFREGTCLDSGSSSDGCTAHRSCSAGGVGLGGSGGGDHYSHRWSSGIGGGDLNSAAIRRQRQRQSSRLAAARGDEGETQQHPHDENDQEEEQESRARPRPSSREEAFYGSSIPVSKRGPPEEDDMWSKHSVFEFKRCGGHELEVWWGWWGRVKKWRR